MVSMLPPSSAKKRCLALVLAAGLAVAMVGCTDAPEPTPTVSTTTESPSPTPTESTPEPTPDPTAEPTDAPTPPDPATQIPEYIAEGEKSAAKYFVELQNYIVAARDVSAWDGRAAEDCVFCETTDEVVRQLLEEGWIPEGGGSEIKTIDEIARDKDVWFVYVTSHEREYLVRDHTGTVVQEASATETELVIGLRFNSHWELVDVG